MKTHQFVVAHRYLDHSALAGIVNSLRKECKKICPTAKEPKLGNHTTILPTSRSPIDEMRQFSMGLKIAESLYGTKKSHQNEAKTIGFDFFRNPGNDAFILRLAFPEHYQEMMVECRRQIERFSEWVFPLHSTVVNPHICIIEGKDLFLELEPNAKYLRGHHHTTRFHLPFPQIMIKANVGENTRWEEFDPNREY